MVEKYFDKAGRHTNIKPDWLSFYKKADNVVKFNLTLVRGTHPFTQTMTRSRSFPLIDASTKLISYQPREEQGTPKTLILPRWRPWLAL